MCTCTVCGELKELEAFSFRNKETGRRHRACKACVAAYGRGHYSANRQAYVRRNNQQTRRRRRVLQAQVWLYLAGHPCVDCGVADPLVLEFDHIDPAAKKKTIYLLVHQACSWSTIVGEIDKCEVRCANCHRRRTAAQFGWAKVGFPLAGFERLRPSPSAAARRPRRAGPPRIPRLSAPSEPVVLATGSKVCRDCRLVKPLDQFHYRNKAADSRHSLCGECFTAYRRAHYRHNKADYIQRNGALQQIRRLEWQRRLWAHLLANPCVDCGERDPIVLEFDHVDRAAKEFTMGFLATRGYAWATVLAELAKCEVRCANCHRRRTAVQSSGRNSIQAKRPTNPQSCAILCDVASSSLARSTSVIPGCVGPRIRRAPRAERQTDNEGGNQLPLAAN